MEHEWKLFRRKGQLYARPYIVGEELSPFVSVSAADKPLREGGMIARNPNNEADQWYINPDYFKQNYEAYEDEKGGDN